MAIRPSGAMRIVPIEPQTGRSTSLPSCTVMPIRKLMQIRTVAHGACRTADTAQPPSPMTTMSTRPIMVGRISLARAEN